MTRQDAIFYIKELQKTYASMDKKVAEAVDLVIEALSAERTGEWVKTYIGQCTKITCSNCGQSGRKLSDNYCPNCGARMRY